MSKRKGTNNTAKGGTKPDALANVKPAMARLASRRRVLQAAIDNMMAATNTVGEQARLYLDMLGEMAHES